LIAASVAMASVLAAQLAQVAGSKPQEHWVRGKASLLFSYQQAADVGADTLLSIAQTGREAAQRCSYAAHVSQIPFMQQ
jgi:hypothetical protein